MSDPMGSHGSMGSRIQLNSGIAFPDSMGFGCVMQKKKFVGAGGGSSAAGQIGGATLVSSPPLLDSAFPDALKIAVVTGSSMSQTAPRQERTGGGKSGRLHPWRMPQPFCSTSEVVERMYPLMVYNSLSRSKVRFIPRDPSRVTWYQCGPTVYAESHMGHARTYVSLDIIRRIARDYLNYNVILCQNVTDIDDKIIIRSAEKGVPFRELAAQYEREFVEDMATLSVPLPDLVTRVSEFIPEIIAFIQGLVDKKIAYASNGSVYFSTTGFQEQGHVYGKLMPEQIGNSELIAEGEGSLSTNDDKRAADDFVLWKKTKDHENGMLEPSWDSPWGPGRPGWHIECSAMSNYAFGKVAGGSLDVHAGGVDLKFPHHENEIAQSEGFSGSHQWVNYWLHTGHVNIKGFKMSKSLKNFITIRQALERYSSRQIRFCFVLHKYNEPMDYGDGSMNHAVSIDKIFSEFFHNVKAVLRRLGSDGPQHVGDSEQFLLLALEEGKAGVRMALMDDFDTPKATGVLLELIRECNRYMEQEGGMSSVILGNVSRFITTILRTFGLVPDSVEIGFPLMESGGDGESSAASREQILTPMLDVLTKFREAVRIAAMSGDSNAVLGAADSLRDIVLPDLGVRMEDKGSGLDVVTIWKLDDPDVLRQERKLKEEAKADKEKQKLETLRKQRERQEKAKTPPGQIFLSQTDLYSAFDSTGLPTHNAVGEPLSKGAIKKLQKTQAQQLELHEKYLVSGLSSEP